MDNKAMFDKIERICSGMCRNFCTALQALQFTGLRIYTPFYRISYAQLYDDFHDEQDDYDMMDDDF